VTEATAINTTPASSGPSPICCAATASSLSTYWPHHENGDPAFHGINVLPTYVPSTTLTSPTRQNTPVLKGELERDGERENDR
jgi:hypothetical protein